MKIIVMTLVFAACATPVHGVTPPDADIDATVRDASVQEGQWWRPWGQACTRPAYGATACVATDNQRGWCVGYGGADVCMPACAGTGFLCPYGRAEYNEGNECFCAPEWRDY